jgi:hypothetical protein
MRLAASTWVGSVVAGACSVRSLWSVRSVLVDADPIPHRACCCQWGSVCRYDCKRRRVRWTNDHRGVEESHGNARSCLPSPRRHRIVRCSTRLASASCNSPEKYFIGRVCWIRLFLILSVTSPMVWFFEQRPGLGVRRCSAALRDLLIWARGWIAARQSKAAGHRRTPRRKRNHYHLHRSLRDPLTRSSYAAFP